jgi:hypothetical protein
MVLTTVSKSIGTILPDGSIIKVFSESGGSWSDGEHRIGEKKQIQLEYSSDVDLTGFNIYVNPALFIEEGFINTIVDKGTYYYAATYNSTTGIDYNMSLQTTAGTINIAPMKNYKVTLVPDGGFVFNLIIEFIMTADEGEYLKPSSNHSKLLQDSTNVIFKLASDNSNISNFAYPNDVYSQVGYSPRIYLFAQNPSNTAIKTSVEEKFTGFGAGFYNRNKYNTAAWFTNTFFKIKRDGVEVSNLADYRNSQIEVYANTENALNPVTHFSVTLIRVDKFDDTVDFWQNYEADSQWIKLANTSTSDISAPMTDPVEVTPGSNQFKATFELKPLVSNAKYRLIGIAYSSVVGQPYKVNSFISTEIIVNAVPEYTGNGMNIRASLDDYNKQYDGHNLECCIEERMRTKLKLDFAFNKWKNDLFDRFGLVSSNDIRVFLRTVKIEIFEEYFDTTYGLGTIRNVFDTKTITNAGLSGFTTEENMTSVFGTTWAEFTYSWRNRFESNVPNVQTLINGAPYLPVMSNQYWGGKTLKVRWTLTFFYRSYSNPFTEEFVIDQQIRVKDYGKMTVSAVNESAFIEQSSICSNSETCFAGILDDNSLTDRKLITNIYPLNGGITSINEAEVWDGAELEKLNTNKIVNQEENYATLFSEKASKFCVDGTKLVVNSQYNISAIAKKFVETGFRITEDSKQRITEPSNKRIIE